MYNNVGVRTTKGAGVSGFIERSRAFGAVRSQYSFDSGSSAAGGGARSRTPAAKRALMPPREAAKDYVAHVLSQKDAEGLTEALNEHMKLRDIKLAVVQMRKRLRTEAGPEANTPDGTARIETIVTRHHADLLGQYIAETEAAAAGTTTASADAKSAKAFADAFGVTVGGAAAAGAEDEDGTAWRFDTGSSFDRRRQAEAKAAAEAAYREKREQDIANAVLKKVQREVDALRSGKGKRARDEPDS
jgi:vacuolar-type H+-ATPase subunit E/Vma4